MKVQELQTLIDEVKIISPKKAPEPTLLDIARFPHRETVFSNILAFFLDSAGPHGFSMLILEALMTLHAKGKGKTHSRGVEQTVYVDTEIQTETGKKLNRLSLNYDVNALHTDHSPLDLIASLKARQQNIKNGIQPFSANILFWGLPGTGKTEFAKYIAQELGKELLVKRMSDLQSMYVGQTEKQITEAFEEAEKEGAVLFLDEADSLILDRKTASRSWGTSQTNEVLTQMENFNGVCICCTNLLDSLDEAVLRRFTWKIKFLPLTDEGKETLFRKYFQPKGRFSNAVKTGLGDIRDLTPGDFKTVHQRQLYAAESSSPNDMVKALKTEASYKRSGSSAIGFSA